MRRRLRKKLGLGEYGLSIKGKMPEVEILDILDRIIEAAESRDLMIGGGGGPEYIDLYVCKAKGRDRTVTDDDALTLVLALQVEGITDIETRRYWSRDDI